MVKDLRVLEKNPRQTKVVANIGMEIMNYCFSKTQENLTKPMPWGDEGKPSGKTPTIISDRGGLLQSGTPPRWENNKRISFFYDSPLAVWVEYGTDPHPVAAKHLEGWARRKLGLQGKEAMRAAYAIANKIRKEGMAAHPFIRPAISQTEDKFNLQRTEEPKL